MYAAFTAVYQPNATTLKTATATNARSASVRTTPRGRTSAASPATSGRTPIPIISAPTAHRPLSIIRSL